MYPINRHMKALHRSTLVRIGSIKSQIISFVGSAPSSCWKLCYSSLEGDEVVDVVNEPAISPHFSDKCTKGMKYRLYHELIFLISWLLCNLFMLGSWKDILRVGVGSFWIVDTHDWFLMKANLTMTNQDGFYVPSCAVTGLSIRVSRNTSFSMYLKCE